MLKKYVYKQVHTSVVILNLFTTQYWCRSDLYKVLYKQDKDGSKYD